MSELSLRYDLPVMAAYVRGMFSDPAHPLVAKPFEALDADDCERLIEEARQKGLKLHYFKRHEELPRVRMALGFLRGVQPQSLLDVGSGRGVFLFPFLEQFPDTPVTSVDLLDRRVSMLDAIHRGGIVRLTALQADICAWDAPDRSFDVVTALEVLEHIPDVAAAVRNIVRLARRYVVVTVPSKPDDNPEHIHLLTKPVLTELFAAAGCRNLRFDGVNGHLFAAAIKE